MRRIELLSITMENFRSFRKQTTFELSQFGGFKFVGGKNEAQPRLGPNGVGKSSLWDALLFCLYNSSVKGIRPGELTSWNADGRAYVQTRWLIDGEDFTIERWGSPNLLTIDGLAVEEANVVSLLGLTRRRFLQAIVFGQGVPLFIDLSVPDRAALLDETLDLGVWLKLSTAAKQEHAQLSKEVGKAKESIARLHGRIDSLSDTSRLDRLLQEWDAAQQIKIDMAIREVNTAEAELIQLENKKKSIEGRIAELPKETISQSNLNALLKYKTELQQGYKALYSESISIADKLKFFAAHPACPTCMQQISAAFRSGQQRDLTSTAARLKNEMQQNGMKSNQVEEELQKKQGAHDAASRKRSFLLEQLATINAQFSAQARTIDQAVLVVEKLAEASNPYAEQLKGLKEARVAANVELRAAQSAIRRIQSTMIQAEYWAGAFRKVRLFLIGRVLAQLEVETASAALALGLIGWSIHFATEAEAKNGNTRLGIFVNITSPEASAPWEVWSGGEAQRIRLAVAIGLSNMIQRLAGISLSFEVWDEPSAWLSQEGIEDLLSCLQQRAESTGKSLWLCDHRAIIYSGFDEIWQVTKTLQGSTIDLINSSEG